MAPGYFLHMCLDPKDQSNLMIQAVIPTGSWFGIVLGDSAMASGADMITFNADELKVTDKHSIGYQ